MGSLRGKMVMEICWYRVTSPIVQGSNPSDPTTLSLVNYTIFIVRQLFGIIAVLVERFNANQNQKGFFYISLESCLLGFA